ncbi:hypothetical protein LTR84_010057 [Exophiala bonariae]|uniref:FAD-binding domain-containing protein n=1 Tax=Exophiala bonariae TaxID=1690606 RepID=A0AAV9NNV1_9EURO|nr:hypothetical protein LTR84_010057 [Exophiala bonariae]
MQLSQTKHPKKSPTEGDTSKILIIGAGLSGLALAQIFRRHGIAFEIFERHEVVRPEKQGWALGLIECIPLLSQHLSDDLGDIEQTSVNWGVREPDSVGIFDGETGAPMAKLGGVTFGSPGYFLRANREHLRKFLAQNIAVTLGKQFSSYTEDSTGVTAMFTDGTSVRGRVLIGADGAYSAVRKQLLGPDHIPQLSPIIPMNGMCELSSTQYAELRQHATSVWFAARPGVFFNIGLCSMKPDGSSGQFYWGVAFPSDHPARDSDWCHTADSTTIYEKCLELTRGMPDWLVNIVSITGPEGINKPSIKFVEYLPPQTFPIGNRVTLLGDAAHTMIPFKGAGANTAITDSCDLGTLIVDAFKQEKDPWAALQQVLDQYNTTMLPRGREAVLASRAAGQSSKGITGILDGRVHQNLSSDAPMRVAV